MEYIQERVCTIKNNYKPANQPVVFISHHQIAPVHCDMKVSNQNLLKITNNMMIT